MISNWLKYIQNISHHFSLAYFSTRNDIAFKTIAEPNLSSSSLIYSHLFQIHVEKAYSIGQLRIPMDENVVKVENVRVRYFIGKIWQSYRSMLNEDFF
jgi:hypothetical protein